MINVSRTHEWIRAWKVGISQLTVCPVSPRHFLSNGDAGWIVKNTCSNNDVLRLGVRPFLCKCPCRRVLVTCRSAFRPPRLAQSDVPSRRVRVSWDLSQRKVLWNVDVHFDYENLHKTGAPLLGRSIILITLCQKKNEMCPCAFRVCKVAHNENSRTDILAANKNRELLQTSFTSIRNMIDLYFCLSFLIPGDQVSVCAWFSLSVANLASGTPSRLRESSTHRVGGKYYCRNAVVVYLSIFSLPATIWVHVFPSAQTCLDVGSVKGTAVSRTTFHLRCGVSEKFYMSRSRDHWAHWLLPHDEGSISSLSQEYFARIFGALCQPVLFAVLWWLGSSTLSTGQNFPLQPVCSPTLLKNESNVL